MQLYRDSFMMDANSHRVFHSHLYLPCETASQESHHMDAERSTVFRGPVTSPYQAGMQSSAARLHRSMKVMQYQDHVAMGLGEYITTFPSLGIAPLEDISQWSKELAMAAMLLGKGTREIDHELLYIQLYIPTEGGRCRTFPYRRKTILLNEAGPTPFPLCPICNMEITYPPPMLELIMQSFKLDPSELNLVRER